jgi:uncharacterized protein with GYD domain
MPHYLVQTSYTSEAWADIIKNPQDRVVAVGKALGAVGGRFVATYLAFGEYDVVYVMEAPDNISAAAIAIAVAAGGAVKGIKTTPLLTIDEGIAAIRKAGEAAASYRPPGS